MMGRPTLFSEEVREQALNYINDGYLEEGHAVPSVLGLARVLKVARSTVYAWGEKEENDFKGILELCGDATEFIALNRSLKNEINSNISKLLLGKFGYADKQDTNLKADIGLSELTDEQLEHKRKALRDSIETE